MSLAVLTPFVSGPAQRQQSGRWRKRVLPVGTINYQGRKLTFDKAYNDSLAAAYQARAYDQVAFQLADAQNTHTNDPERFRGDIVSMDSQPDGLYIEMAPTAAGEKVLRDNPNLGVSARIVEGYERSDGQFYPAAIQHVLGTLDPRIPGLGGWRTIDNASGDMMTIDLSGSEFAGQQQKEGTSMPDLSEKDRQDRLAKLLAIPPEQIDQLLAGIAGAGGQNQGTGTDGQGDDDFGLTDEELAELEAAAAELDATGLLDDDLTGAGAGAGASGAQLSGAAQLAIEMANVNSESALAQLRGVTAELDEQRYVAERRRLADDLGIPPYITDLARPVLEGAGHVVDLSNGTSVDSGQIVRKVFEAFGKLHKMLEPGIELGTAMDEPDAEGANTTARDDLKTRFKGQTGIF
jgi:hypothetical protein